MNNLHGASSNTHCAHDDLDYRRLKRSLEFLVEQYVLANVFPDDSHPVRRLERDERRNMTIARRYLSGAIMDLVEATQGFSIEHILAADLELERRGAYTLSMLRSRFPRRDKGTHRRFETSFTYDFISRSLPSRCKRILEIGCGTGQLAARLAEDGFDVTAIDSNKEVIIATRQLGFDARLAKWPEFNDGQFDAVLFTRSLHHMHPLQESLHHALECLSDGGRIIVEDFAYEAADVRSLHWFTTIARKFAASGFLREKSGLVGKALANGLTLESWSSNHHPDLNSAAAIAEELKVVFGDCIIKNAAYYFRYLAAAMGPLEQRDSIIAALAADEWRLISKGAIASLGRRFVAKRFLG
jgi:SAM-dependent methyltransferase